MKLNDNHHALGSPHPLKTNNLNYILADCQLEGWNSQPEMLNQTHSSLQTVAKKIALDGEKVEYYLEVLLRFSLNKNEA